MRLSKTFLITLFLITLFFLTGCSQVDTSQCDNLAPTNIENKIDCYIRLAAETLDSNVCDNIQKLTLPDEQQVSSPDELQQLQIYKEKQLQFYEDSCRMGVVFQSNTSNPKACKSISTPNIQGQCYSYIAMQSETPSLCLKAAKLVGREGNGENVFRDCFSTIAVKKSDMRVCNSMLQYVDAEYLQLFCPGCSQPAQQELFELYLPSDCLLSYAYQSKDPAACALVREGQKGVCYQQMANIFEDASYCIQISEDIPINSELGITYDFGKLKNTCFEEVAVRKKDKKICDNIPPIDMTNATNLLSALFPQGQINIPDSLSLRKECYRKVDQALGINTPTPADNFFSNLTLKALK